MGNDYEVRGYNANRHMSSVQQTGINSYDKVANIYDLEGNCAEYVAEKSIINDYTFIVRGGYYYKGAYDWSSNRATDLSGEKKNNCAFRIVLYII